MEHWQLDLIERVTRIEANQEFMKANIKDLPQSAKCEKDITALKKEVTELQSFKDAINTKVAYIGGVLVLMGLFIPYALKWVFDHLSFKL